MMSWPDVKLIPQTNKQACRKRRLKVGPNPRGSGMGIPKEDLWVRYPVGAGPSPTKDFKNGNGPCLHGT